MARAQRAPHARDRAEVTEQTLWFRESLTYPMTVMPSGYMRAIFPLSVQRTPSERQCVNVLGELDTGCSWTVVDPTVATALNLTQVASEPIRRLVVGVDEFESPVYTASLRLGGNQAAAVLEIPDLRVLSFPIAAKGFHVLIGLDALEHCALVVNGPAREFTVLFGPADL